MMKPFKPRHSSTVSLSASTTTSRVNLTLAPKNAEFQVRIVNAGSATAFIKRGGASVTAATTDIPILPNTVEVLTFENTDSDPQDYVAGITSSGTAALSFTIGFGL